METIETGKKNKGGFVKWAMIVAIVIVLNMFFNYAISLVYKAPQYDDFVKQTQVVIPITNKDDCLKIGGQWTDPVPLTNTMQASSPRLDNPTGYCDPNYTNQNKK